MLAAVLVLLLGHESYTVRDASEAGLLVCPQIGSILAGTLSPDPERQSRSTRLLEALQGDCSTPYLDALPDDYPEKMAVIHRYVKIALDAGFARQTWGDWPAYRQATVLWLADGGDYRLLPPMRRRTVCFDTLGRWEPQ